jgi:hypothetical protein
MNLKEKLYVKSERDGLTEIVTGLLFLFYSTVIDMLMNYSTHKGKIALIIIFFAFSGPVIQFLRKRFTYAKSGYVKVEPMISKRYLFITIFPIAFFPMLIGILKYLLKLEGLTTIMLHYSTLCFGFILMLFYLNYLKTTGERIFRIFTIFSPSAGILLFLYNNALDNTGIILFFLMNGSLMLVFGIFKCLHFFSTIRKSEGDKDGQ